MSLLGSAGRISGLCVSDRVLVGRDYTWGISKDDVSTDFGVRRVWMKHDALFHQLSAVLKSGYLVVEAFVSESSV